MSRPFGIIAALPRRGKPSPPYQGLSNAQQGEAIRKAEAKREMRNLKRLAELARKRKK